MFISTRRRRSEQSGNRKKPTILPILSPVEGLNWNDPSPFISQKQTPRCKNIIFYKNKLMKRHGFAQYGTGLPLNGIISWIDQLFLEDGNDYLLFFTSKDIYRLDPSDSTYKFLTPLDTTGTVTCAAGTTVEGVGVDWVTTGIKAGDKIGFETTDPDAVTTWYTVASVTDLDTLELTGNGPTVAGVTYVIRLLLQGSSTTYMYNIFNPVKNAATGTNQNIGLYCNFVDYPLWWNGDTSTYFAELTGANAANQDYKAKFCIYFGGRTVLLNTKESGMEFPRRIRWTIAGASGSGANYPRGHAAADWTGAGSGYEDLDIGDDWIIDVEYLKDSVVIRCERSIWIMEYIGGTKIFDLRRVLGGVGSPSPRCGAVLLEEVAFMGWDNIYVYNLVGTDELGDVIKSDLFERITPSKIDIMFSHFIEEFNLVRWFMPLGASTVINGAIEYNYKIKSWTEHTYSKNLTASGYYEVLSTDDKINDISDKINTLSRLINSRYYQEAAPLNLYGDDSGYIYKEDYTVYKDDATAIDGYWESKDFGHPDKKFRWYEVEFDAKGDTVDVAYSSDFGATFTGSKTFTLTTTWARYTFFLGTITHNYIRFRFRNNVINEYFELRAITLKFSEVEDI